MLIRPILILLAAFGSALLWPGCAGPGRKSTPPGAVEPQKSEREILLEHLTGRWEAPAQGGKEKIAVFDSGGALTFSGALETYNPAQWDLDAGTHELHITFPALPNKKLQIFQLYVGQGIKSFQPAQKQITFTFKRETWTLNMAGWDYSKVDQAPKYQVEPEPVIH